jgi:hypothetical protein
MTITDVGIAIGIILVAVIAYTFWEALEGRSGIYRN